MRVGAAKGLVVAVGLVVAGCVQPAGLECPSPDGGTAPVDAGAPDATGCLSYKFRFQRDAGCANDGAIEFCVSDTPSLRAAIAAIAPGAQAKSGAGHLQCAQLRYEFPTPPSDTAVCLAPRGALSDGAWGQLCQLAELQRLDVFAAKFAE